MGKAYCGICNKKCRGSVLKVGDKYFHRACFKCEKCSKSLETGGFFQKENSYYCPEDYNRYFSAKCRLCGGTIEGEVVSALSYSFHRQCFHCQDCRRFFAPGDRATLWKDRFFCKICVQRRQLTEKENFSPQTTDDEGRANMTNGSDVSPPTTNGELRVQVDGNATDRGYVSAESCVEKSVFSPVSIPPSDASPSCFSASSGEESQSERQSRSRTRRHHPDFGKFYPQSYLNPTNQKPPMPPQDHYKRSSSAASNSSLARPQHFHRPDNSNFSYRNLTSILRKGQSLPSMKVLGHSRHSNGLTRREPPPVAITSPENGTDPRRLALYPGGHEPDTTRAPPIDRYDWPAPASSAVVLAEKMREKRRAHGHDTMDYVSIELSIDSRLNQISDVNGSEVTLNGDTSGMAKAINMEERKRHTRSVQSLDPVSASRTPNAKAEPSYKTRYNSHHQASPRPGYTQGILSQPSKSSGLPFSAFNGGLGRARSEDLHGRYSAFDSVVSVSVDGNQSVDEGVISSNERPDTSRLSLQPRSSRHRERDLRSMSELSYPDVHYCSTPSAIFRKREKIPPQKIAYEDLRLSNLNPIKGLDRASLETYLTDEDFIMIFQMSREAFYHLPEWKRNDLKKRVHLF